MGSIDLLSQQGRKDDGEVLFYFITFELFTQSETEPLDNRDLQQLVTNHYDYIFIDTPPNLGLLTVNALMACTNIIIPLSLTTYALIGISILEKTMQEL